MYDSYNELMGRDIHLFQGIDISTPDRVDIFQKVIKRLGLPYPAQQGMIYQDDAYNYFYQ